MDAKKKAGELKGILKQERKETGSNENIKAKAVDENISNRIPQETNSENSANLELNSGATIGKEIKSPSRKNKDGSSDVKPEKDNGSDVTTSSSGIGSASSEKADSLIDGNIAPPHVKQENHDRIIYLSQRSEWILLEQHLRSVKRGHPSLSKTESVSKS